MEKKNIDWSSLGFGYVKTDKRFVSNYSGGAWDDGVLTDDATITMSECACVLQYAQTCFEGMKAYTAEDGRIVCFRPDLNAARMAESCKRLKMPVYPEDKFVDAVIQTVRANAAWVPPFGSGATLYIRPFMFGNDETLGVHAVHNAVFAVICGPVGSYYKEGINPVGIMIEHKDVRAVRGGTGEAKCGGNYAAANRAGDKAMEKGYSQVLWLDGVQRKYVEEGGGMNVMFKIAGTVVTPMLTGSILPGITRKSCIELLKSWGIPVEERLLSVDELFEAAKNGTLEEAWCVGTAAVVSPIGELAWNDEKYEVNQNRIGALSQRLYDELTGIQWGTRPDPFGWTCVV